MSIYEKIKENLLRSFVGELQRANNIFTTKARKKGYEQIAAQPARRLWKEVFCVNY